MKDNEKKPAPVTEEKTAEKKPVELNEADLGKVAGGGWFDDIVEWFEDWRDDVVTVSYNAAAGKFICPECDDGNHMLGCCSMGMSVSGGTVDVYKCDHCKKWFWHYTSGDKAGKWRYRPDQD